MTSWDICRKSLKGMVTNFFFFKSTRSIQFIEKRRCINISFYKNLNSSN